MYIVSTQVAEQPLPPHVIAQVTEDYRPPWGFPDGIAITVAAFGYGHRQVILPHNTILPFNEKILK